MTETTLPAADTAVLSESDQYRSALLSAHLSLSTAESMAASVLAIFETMDIADTLSEQRNGFELLCAIEACLEKIRAEAMGSLALLDSVKTATGQRFDQGKRSIHTLP